jgi:small neutral amino acid transporter SnatA (MarC family)
VILVWLLLGGAVWLFVTPPERCPDLTTQGAQASSTEAVGWFQRNLLPDGTFRYRVDLETGDDLGGYLAVRHAGVMLSLYQAARAGIPGALETGDAARGWAFANLVPAAGGLTFAPPGTPYDTGPAALLAAALTERRQLTGDPSDDATLAGLGTFLSANVGPDGQVAGRYDPVGGPQYDEPSPFFTGETFYALAKLHTAFPGAGYDGPARRVATFVATERDAVEGYWPGVPDHWSSYGFAEMTTAWPAGQGSLTDADRAYLRRQSGIASFETRWESQRTNEFPTTITRGSQVSGAGLGTVGEHLSNLFRVASVDDGLADTRNALAERARCVSGMIQSRQLTAVQAVQESAQPPLVQGAWFREGVTQMDDQQHTLSALLLSYPNVEGIPLSEPALNTWLALLAIVALWNPGYVAAGVPAGPRGRRTLYTAAGCLIGGGVLVGLAALGDWVLDALDISVPTAWVAAGLVVLAGAWMSLRGPQSLVGGLDVVTPVGMGRGPLPPAAVPPMGPTGMAWPTMTVHTAAPTTPTIEGKVAFVPIAWPLVLRPTLAVAALAFGVTPGPLLLAGACVLAAVLTVAIVELWPSTVGEPWWNRWTRNLFSALGVLAGVAVLVDGVFGI